MINYKKAGVDIDRANRFVDHIKKIAPNIGGFSGLYPIDGKRLLSGSCDGVGTKLKIAHLLKKHDTIGIDLVAMNVNDVVCSGARPLFFLDYFACGKLNLSIARDVIKGIKKGCDLAGCALLGGETAEMPGFYKGDDYDLAGFVTGIVEKKHVIDGSRVAAGDLILGLPSSGPHSNGYSLIRKALSEKEIKERGKELLAPTRIYVKEILRALKLAGSSIHALCHITGGGFYDNIVRLLPANRKAVIDKSSWRVPSIFRLIQEKGGIPEKEMYRTLNMGIGMVLIVKRNAVEKIRKHLKDALLIGRIIHGKKEVVIP